jgi:hypothetical protein
MGVLPPSQEEFDVAFPPTKKVNDPQEGVIVLEAPPVVDGESGSEIDPDAPAFPGVEVMIDEAPEVQPEGPTPATQKRLRRKKEDQSNEA